MDTVVRISVPELAQEQATELERVPVLGKVLAQEQGQVLVLRGAACHG